jgi:UDPglucose 6-dehydrogenase
MKVAVIGTGYVGLVSGVCLAEKGHTVVCIDVDRAKVELINGGVSPIYEKGLEALLSKNLGVKLTASTDLMQAILDADISIIAVGTPFDGENIDLRYIEAAARQIGTALAKKSGYHVVVVKSTVVPGTTRNTVLPLLESCSGKRAGTDFGVGMNPEFLREGEAVEDFLNPDRLVLGGIDARSLEAMDALYAGFPDVERVRTDPSTAELIKYTSNALLSTLISFSNEVANLGAKIGVDVVEVLRGVQLDKRFSPILPSGERLVPSFVSYLAAGCGFGGSCFPKDVKALVAFGAQRDSPMRVLKAVLEVNELQPSVMLDLLAKHHPLVEGVRVGVLGVAFKPGTDDIRESPALVIFRKLLDDNARVHAYDPVAAHAARPLFGDAISWHDSLESIIASVDALLIVTRWDAFLELPALLSKLDNPPVVIDGRRMLQKNSVPRYEGVGLPWSRGALGAVSTTEQRKRS